MSGVTDNYGLILPATGEAYDVAIINANNIAIDAQLKKLARARNATFNMATARSSTVGAGVAWGWLQADAGRSSKSTIQNDFCVIDNSGTAGAADETGRIRITKEGIYDLAAQYTCTANPGQLNFAIQLTKVEGGTEKIATMNRSGTYGDWEATVTDTGRYLKVGDYITGYQANSNAVTWAMGMRISYKGETL